MRAMLAIGVLAGLALSAPSLARASCDLSGLPDGTQVAELQTALGSICIELFTEDATLHVENFLYYETEGLLQGTFIHRRETGFVIQGGGFTLEETDFAVVPAREVVVENDPCTPDIPSGANAPLCSQICSERGNERGTIALAKGSDPSSGSTNWFINLDDNRSILDCPERNAFTVFGRVTDATMSVVDAIASLPTGGTNELFWLESPFQTLETFIYPMLEAPDYGSESYTCWDPLRQATVVVQPTLLGDDDPETGFFPYTVAAANDCGTVITQGCAADPACLDTSTHKAALTTTGPVELLPRPDLPESQSARYYSFSNATLATILSERMTWQAWFKTSYRQQLEEDLIFMESTNVTTVPESASGFAVIAVLAALARRGRRTASS